MKKKLTFLFLISLAFSLNAQKGVFMGPFNRVGDDYCNKHGSNGTKMTKLEDLADERERWCAARTHETESLICFWEAGFGTDVKKMIHPDGYTFDLTESMNNLEELFQYQLNELEATHADGANLKKYKLMIMLSHTNNWIAYGGGYDEVIGAMWLNPLPMGIPTKNYFTLFHELFHAMSAQARADRKSNEYAGFTNDYNGPFWERSANHAAMVKYPDVVIDFARYSYLTHSHFLCTRRHYTNSFLLEHLDEEYGKNSLGKLWTQNKNGEHPLVTMRRLFFDNDQSKLNAFVGKTAMKNMVWDYPAGSNGEYMKNYLKGINYNTNVTTNVDRWNIVQKHHRTILYAVDYEKRHFAVRDCQAPQDYAYNAIQLFPEEKNEDGSATFKMRFRGHNEDKASDWRWGFTAIQADGSPRYSQVYNDVDKTVEFTMNATDKEVWLTVVGVPADHTIKNNYKWEAGFPKYYRYPYEVRFENAVPMGYNADFESQQGITTAPHPNGGGLVAKTANVEATVYVGPNAKVLGSARVRGNARIEDFAIVKGSAQVYGNAVIKENAMVFSNAKVYGDAVVSGSARVFNNTTVYDQAFITDNAFVHQTNVYGNAIVCGNLWQRGDGIFNIGGTAVVGGDPEDMGSVKLLTGTYLQLPEQGNNGRSNGDGKGNLTVEQLNRLKENWNNIPVRLDILNKSISNASSNPNYDVNSPYVYFNSSEMEINGEGDGEFTVTNHEVLVIVSGNIPENTTYSLINEAGITVIEKEAITESTSISIPFTFQQGKYMVKVFVNDSEYFCGEIAQF